MSDPEQGSPAADLQGVRVLAPRARQQGRELVERLRARGAQVLWIPLLEILPPEDLRPLERAAAELALYDWVVFTSANAVDALLERCGGALPSRLRTAVVGPATGRRLESYEVEADVVADRRQAEGLAEALAPHVRRRRRVLLPQAADAQPLLGEALEEAGAEVVRVTAYRKTLPAESATRLRELAAEEWLPWILCTSPSTVRNLRRGLGRAWERHRPHLRAVSVGPVTSAALRKLEIEPREEAREPGVPGLVEALVRAVGRSGETRGGGAA